MAKDIFHQEVVNALEKDGWRITHDPLVLPFEDINYQIDLGAEGVVGAERAGEKIAVEIKNTKNPVEKDSVVLLNQIRTVSIEHRIEEKIGSIPGSKMEEIDGAINISLGLN